jgi:hypothetical protein
MSRNSVSFTVKSSRASTKPLAIFDSADIDAENSQESNNEDEPGDPNDPDL